MPMRLFSSARSEPARRAAVPEGTRVYAIGDIHGRADLLLRLHDMIAEDASRWPDCRKIAVYLGDFVDRGLEVGKVVDILLDAPLAGFESVYLLGNHEASLLQFLDDISIGSGWLFYGGTETLYSYGVNMPSDGSEGERLTRIQAELAAKIPERHRAFFRTLRLHHVEGDYLFVHAGIRPGVPLERQDKEDLLWIRDKFIHSNTDHGKVVVHGHTISEHPEVKPNRIGIDTGAFATGVLTCLVLHGAERNFIQTLG